MYSANKKGRPYQQYHNGFQSEASGNTGIQKALSTNPWTLAPSTLDSEPHLLKSCIDSGFRATNGLWALGRGACCSSGEPEQLVSSKPPGHQAMPSGLCVSITSTNRSRALKRTFNGSDSVLLVALGQLLFPRALGPNALNRFGIACQLPDCEILNRHSPKAV